MDTKEIMERAEQYRHISPSMSNYKVMLNDAWVLLRELAKRVSELESKSLNARLEGDDVPHEEGS